MLDGELAIPIGDTLSFDALQMRIHPAESRIKKLAVETPALLILFDMLLDAKGNSLIEAPLVKRRAALERFYKTAGEPKQLKLSPCTREPRAKRSSGSRMRAALLTASSPSAATVLTSPASEPCSRSSTFARPTAWWAASATRRGSREVGSLLLGLYDDEGKLDHVGFTSTITNEERPALTKAARSSDRAARLHRQGAGRAEPLEHRALGEWEPLKPKLVVEVRYDQVTGDRFRHGTKLIRFRPDKAPRQCTFEQIASAVLPKTSSFCSSEVAVGSNSGPIELRCFAPWEGRLAKETSMKKYAFAACFAVVLATPVLAAEQFYVALDTSTKQCL